jgi:hypothetical protein
MINLNNNDYKQILEYYNEPIPNSKEQIKNHAEHILASKLCRCIKKVDKKNEARSIGICTKTILNAKGITRGKFKCKDKASITLRKVKNGRKGLTIKNRNRNRK